MTFYTDDRAHPIPGLVNNPGGVAITLNNGLIAYVDECDAHLAGHKWFAHTDTTGKVYARRNVPLGFKKQGSERLHRVVMGLPLGVGRPIVDHIDGDGLNNRRANLRVATHAENARNRAGAQKNNQGSRFLGVRKQPNGRFGATIKVNYRVIHLGVFATEEEAHRARLAAEREHWGVMPRRAAEHTAMEAGQ